MRTITLKTLVTDAFRQKAQTEMGNELHLVMQQQEQLEAQVQAQLKQLEDAKQQGMDVDAHVQELHQQYQMAHLQLAEARAQLQQKIEEIDTIANGTYLTTGKLESPVQLNVGDSIYEKIGSSEILIKDGVITAMLG
jgi:DNA repair ATPase RecN